VGKSGPKWPKIWSTFVISKKVFKYNNHPMDENSPDMVTLRPATNRFLQKVSSPSPPKKKEKMNRAVAQFLIQCGFEMDGRKLILLSR
jgi:hypothetical protein